jgi:hypothetical protein
MPFEPDPYRTLGLTRGATLDEVKRAYRRLAKANHPDAAGPAALSRFLAIQAAYEQLAGSSAEPGSPRRASPGTGSRSSGPANDARSRAGRAQDDRARDGARGRPERGRTGATGRPGTRGRPGATGRTGPDRAERGAPSADGPPNRPSRGKATLGSTSYDGADAGPFEPDWGGASWYGTTSGTYWTINPKEYADPRKHGPEYQARARRATGGRATSEAAGGDAGPDPLARPTHTTESWWTSTAGPEEPAEPGDDPQTARADPDPGHPARGGGDGPPTRSAGPAGAASPRGSGTTVRDRFARATGGQPRASSRDDAAPDPARAAVELGRALTDPHSGGLRGRVVRAAIGWIPIALGIGWLVGELSGCGRFAATCDPSVLPLTAVGQGIVLLALLVVPEVAAIAAGAAIVLLAAAVGASLILSATGAAADEASRRAALGALLVVSWMSGLAIAIVRRLRSGPRTSRPVS